jgi:hypothetical protein
MNPQSENNIVIVYKTYTPSQKRANLKYKAKNLDKINALAKKYYDQNKDDPVYKEKKRESARKYYQKIKSKKLDIKNEGAN